MKKKKKIVDVLSTKRKGKKLLATRPRARVEVCESGEREKREERGGEREGR